MTVHMIHIGKTGGSAIKSALAEAQTPEPITFHSHRTALAEIPADERFFIFLRDPIRRFVSGFNSRLRCGKPRIYSRWNEPERTAFGLFQTPTALAEAIGTPEGDRAMRDIRHVNTLFTDLLVSVDYLMSRDPLLIGWQETLDVDFARLCTQLGVKGAALPTDPIISHRTPQGFSTELSPAAIENLQTWYAKDLAFCAELRDRSQR